MSRNYAIIGFGCAGYHALKAIRESDENAEIHIYSETNEPPANPMLTTYYAADRISYDGMFPFGSLEKLQSRYQPILHMEEKVVSLLPDEKAIVLGSGEKQTFDAILLATGATPLVPPLGVTTGNRTLCMRTVEDAKLLRERVTEGNVTSVTVIGGSMVGIKIVELFRDLDIRCVLADMAPHIFPLQAFEDVSREIESRLEAKGVELKFGSAVQGAEETDDEVTTRFADGSSVTTDLLVLCIGTRARMELAKEAGLAVNRGILVNDSMETSAPCIYAAGDCCEGKNIMTGGHQIIGLWANAAYQGETAGHSMAQDPTVFSGNILHNITHFMGMDFISYGDVNAEGKVHTIGEPRGERYIKAVVADGEIKCINLLDNYKISGVVKNYLMNRFNGNKAPLPVALRGLLAEEGFSDEFLALFEGGELS